MAEGNTLNNFTPVINNIITTLMLKKVLIGLLVVLVIIQFIRPDMNKDDSPQPNDISKVYTVPQEVQTILHSVCYDCHSNKTTYPWYFNIQPLAWWLDSHIEEGKGHLNFSIFGTYEPKKQAHKMEEVAEMVENKEMPLKSYTWTHEEARLKQEERELLINWAKQMQADILASAGSTTTTN